MGLTNYWPFTANAQTRFERLLKPHLKTLYRLAYRYTGSRDDAEDLVQDLLLKLYPRLQEIQTVDRLEPWLARVLYRLFVDQYRRQQRSPIDTMFDEDVVYGIHASTTAGPAEVVNMELTQQLLSDAMGRLKQDHRIPLILHEIEGYNLQEISDILDVPVGTIKSRLNRARSKLREIVRNMEPNHMHDVYNR